MARGYDRREPRGAQPVDGDTGDLLREACEQSGHAGDVAVVLPRLVGGAEVDVLDLPGRDTRTLDRLAHDERGEVVGPLAGQGASVAPHGRANGGEDDCLRHDLSLRVRP